MGGARSVFLVLAEAAKKDVRIEKWESDQRL